MDKLKKVLSGNDEEAGDREEIITGDDGDDVPLLQRISDSSSLSWSTRIQGFAICFALGWLISLIGSFFLGMGTTGITIFAVFYTLGNILSLASTCFLMGPLKQLEKMFAPTRLIATLAMLGFMALTLMSAFWWRNVALTVLFCILEFLALTWYSISYIPYARTAVKNAFSACIG